MRDLGLDSAAENNLCYAVRLYVDKLLPPEPTSFQNRLGLAIACRHLGLLLQRAAQTECAEKEFWRAVQLLEELQKEHADDPYVGDELAACYEHLSDAGRAAGQDEKAVEHLAKAQDLRSRLPDFPEYSAQRVRLLLKHADKKNCGEAASLADRLVNTAHGNGTSLTLRALVHFRAGEPAACIERLEAADVTEFDASQAERHFLLAMA